MKFSLRSLSVSVLVICALLFSSFGFYFIKSIADIRGVSANSLNGKNPSEILTQEEEFDYDMDLEDLLDWILENGIATNTDFVDSVATQEIAGMFFGNIQPFFEYIIYLGYDFTDIFDVISVALNYKQHYDDAMDLELLEPNANCIFLFDNSPTYSTDWSAGSGFLTYGIMQPNNGGTHQEVTRRALQYSGLQQYSNIFTQNNIDAIILNSDWPDAEETDNLNNLHFYSGGQNFMRNKFDSGKNARERFEYRYNQAVALYESNPAAAMVQLGAALHYMADLNTPVHVGDRMPQELMLLSPLTAMAVLSAVATGDPLATILLTAALVPAYVLVFGPFVGPALAVASVGPTIAFIANQGFNHAQFESVARGLHSEPFPFHFNVIPNNILHQHTPSTTQFNNMSTSVVIQSMVSTSSSYYYLVGGGLNINVSYYMRQYVASQTLPNAVDACAYVLKKFAQEITIKLQMDARTINVATVSGTEITLQGNNDLVYITLTLNSGGLRTFSFDGNGTTTTVKSPTWTHLNGNFNFSNVKIVFNTNTLFTVQAPGTSLNGMQFSNSAGFSSMRISLLREPSWVGISGAGISLVSQSPIVITNQTELVNAVSSNSNGHFILANNISLTGQWTPLTLGPNGIFDGNGKTISGLTVTGRSITHNEENIGLFSINHGLIRNLTLSNINIVYSPDHGWMHSSVGGVAGLNYGVICSVWVFDGVIQVHREMSCMGGIVGINYGMIQYSYTDWVTLFGNGDMGGIAGANVAGGVIAHTNTMSSHINFYWNTTNRTVGGIVGYNSDARLYQTNVYYTNVTYINSYVSGEAHRTPFMGLVVGLVINSEVWTVGAEYSNLNAGNLIGPDKQNQRIHVGNSRWWNWGGWEVGNNHVFTQPLQLDNSGQPILSTH